MARPLRIEYPGAVYHVTSRGNGGADIALDDGDRADFTALLGEAVARFGWLCHAYCLMDTLAEIGAEAGLHYATVSRIIKNLAEDGV